MTINKKGFSLIEILIVLAIIGVLAAIGIPAYNGYINTAKINATKANHKQIVNYVSAEIAKCNAGGVIIFNDKSGTNKTWNCSATTPKASNLQYMFVYTLKADKWMNPYISGKTAIYGSRSRSCSSTPIGVTNIGYVGTNYVTVITNHGDENGKNKCTELVKISKL